MKKKYTGDESENEFSVDEPEELQGSDDDWTPAAGETGRRTSRRLRNTANKKPRLAEPSSSEEEEEEEEEEDEDSDTSAKGKKAKVAAPSPKSRGRPGRKPQITPVATSKLKAKIGVGDNIVSCEATSTTGVAAAAAAANNANAPTEKEFTSGAFVVLKTDISNGGDPPIWKIDGKALLQKYVPFEQDGKMLYKNTSTYSGWSANNKDLYYPAPIVFKMQNRKETIVEFLKDNIKVDAPKSDDGEDGTEEGEEEGVAETA